MKTTIDLPDDLLRQLKFRAVRDRELKDLAADLLRSGLAGGSREKKPSPQPTVIKDKKTGLPVIQCPRAAPANQELTPERIADILIQQESEWYRDSA